MTTPIIALLAIALFAIVAVAFLSARIHSQLRELQSQWLKDIAAQRDLHNHNTKLLESKFSESAELNRNEERNLQQRVDKLAGSISNIASDFSGLHSKLGSITSELAETKNEIRSLPLFDHKTRADELKKRLDALTDEHRTAVASLDKENKTAIASLDKEHRAAVASLEKNLHAARELGENKARDLALAQGELKRADAEIKALSDASKSTGLSLETVRNSLRDADARAARFEKQLLEIVNASRLEKQLMERLAAAEERINALSDALRKAEGDVWSERTAKESMSLEVRAVRDDIKRLNLRLSDETQKREALEKWAEDAKAKLAEGGSSIEPSPLTQSPVSKALAPLPSSSEATAPAPLPSPPRSMRPTKQTQAALAAAAKKNQPEEPPRITSWWCSICGRGGTNLATACKHEWKRNALGEMT